MSLYDLLSTKQPKIYKLKMSSMKRRGSQTVEPGGAPMKSRPGLIVCLVLLVLASALPYLFSLNGQFILDDKSLIIVDNTAHSLKNISAAFTQHFFGISMKTDYYRPVVTVSYIINYAMFGESPIGYRVTNLLFHLIATLLVFVLGRRLLDNTKAALLAGLIFAVHPAHTESVAWIAGRTDLLAAIFALSALIFYDKYLTNGGRRWYWASAVFLLAGLLSKEVVIVVPVMMFALERFCRKGGSGARSVIRIIPFLVITVMYLVARQIVLGHLIKTSINDVPLWYRVYAAPTAIVWYLKILLLPKIAEPIHDFIKYTIFYPVIAVAGWAVVAGLSAFALAAKRRFGVVSFCIAWLMLTLVPVSNIVRLPWPFLCERFLYLPSIGFSLLFGLAFSRLLTIRSRPLADIWPMASVTAVAGVLVYCVMQTYAGASLWTNNMALVTRMLEIESRFSIIRIYAGDTYAEIGDLARAAKEYKYVADLDPKDKSVRAILVMLYSQLGDYKAAAKTGTELAKLRPNDAAVHNDLGIALASIKDYTAAIKAFRRALELKPDSAKIRFNLARTLAKNNDRAGAVKEYEEGLKIKPSDKRAKKELELLKGRQ